MTPRQARLRVAKRRACHPRSRAGTPDGSTIAILSKNLLSAPLLPRASPSASPVPSPCAPLLMHSAARHASHMHTSAPNSPHTSTRAQDATAALATLASGLAGTGRTAGGWWHHGDAMQSATAALAAVVHALSKTDAVCDLYVTLPSGRLLRERFVGRVTPTMPAAADAHTEAPPDARVPDALAAFSPAGRAALSAAFDTGLGPILAATAPDARSTGAPEDDWLIKGDAWRPVWAPPVFDGVDDAVFAGVFERVVNRVCEAVQRAALSADVHVLRVFAAVQHDDVLACEVRLDDAVFAPAADVLDAVPWPTTPGYVAARQTVWLVPRAQPLSRTAWPTLADDAVAQRVLATADSPGMDSAFEHVAALRHQGVPAMQAYAALAATAEACAAALRSHHSHTARHHPRRAAIAPGKIVVSLAAPGEAPSDESQHTLKLAKHKAFQVALAAAKHALHVAPCASDAEDALVDAGPARAEPDGDPGAPAYDHMLRTRAAGAALSADGVVRLALLTPDGRALHAALDAGRPPPAPPARSVWPTLVNDPFAPSAAPRPWYKPW